MGVWIDKTRHNNLTARVNDLCIGVVQLAPHLDDTAVVDCYVTTSVKLNATHHVAC
jgi:Flp pilus assembly CpaF family ATPase